MALFINLPFELRLALLFLTGILVGSQLNRGIYRLAYHRRAIGPWSKPEPQAPPRVWSDYVPVWGWLGLSRESELHGPGFWVRPLLIELATGAGFAGLYAWELEGNLLPVFAAGAPGTELMIHWQCLSHLVLGSLMLVATFIDFDEKTIPDEITVTGTLVALLLAATVPLSLLSTTVWPVKTVGPLLLSSPDRWPAVLDGPWGLVAGLACYWCWCGAIVPSLWTTRRGLYKAIQYQLVSMVRGSGVWRYLVLGAIGGTVIAGVWWFGGVQWTGEGTPPWHALLSALIGLAFGGGLIWGVRIVGSAALGKEAMGFGDVTLMAMIGAFLGWQPSLMVFFLAPFAALLIAVTQWVITRRHDIAFGPYLCLGALILVVRWRALWHEWAEAIFTLGWWIPAIVLVCLFLMGFLLSAWQMVKSRWL